SCSAEVHGSPRPTCMTRMSELDVTEPVTVSPMQTFPIVKDLVTDVSLNYERARGGPPFRPRPKDPVKEGDGRYRMQQVDIDRVQEFRKCIECFLCQNVCHVIRDHPDNAADFA